MQKSYSSEYREVQVLGRGNYGVAYLVVSNKDQKYYVAKKMHLEGMKESEQVAAKQEVQILRKMDCAFVVKYIDSYLKEGQLIIVMEYCEEGDLAFFIKNQKKRGEPIGEPLIVNWFVQIAIGLKVIHNNKILHRDIKSNNIFLTSNGTIKIGDFGISKVLETMKEEANTFVGTPYYLSPEVCENRAYSYKSDVWALGCVLYQLCTLNYAFNANSLLGLVFKIVKDKVEKIPSIYSADLSNLVMRLLNKNQNQRPTIDEILNSEYVKREMTDFVKKGGNLQVYIPIKGTNIHETVKQEVAQAVAQNSETLGSSLVYTQTLNTIASQQYEEHEEVLTPMQRLQKKKEEENRRRQQQLKGAALASLADRNDARMRKNQQLMGSQDANFFKQATMKTHAENKEKIDKLIEAAKSKVVTQAIAGNNNNNNANTIKRKQNKHIIDYVPGTAAYNPTHTVAKKYDVEYEDVPLQTTEEFVNFKSNEDDGLEEYYDEDFEVYEEDEVRLTNKAPKSELDQISKIYQDQLKGVVPPPQSPLKKTSGTDSPMKSTNNTSFSSASKNKQPQQQSQQLFSGANLCLKKIDACKQEIGAAKYDQIYSYMKKAQDQGKTGDAIYSYLEDHYGKAKKGVFRKIEEIIYLESMQ